MFPTNFLQHCSCNTCFLQHNCHKPCNTASPKPEAMGCRQQSNQKARWQEVVGLSRKVWWRDGGPNAKDALTTCMQRPRMQIHQRALQMKDNAPHTCQLMSPPQGVIWDPGNTKSTVPARPKAAVHLAVPTRACSQAASIRASKQPSSLYSCMLTTSSLYLCVLATSNLFLSIPTTSSLCSFMVTSTSLYACMQTTKQPLFEHSNNRTPLCGHTNNRAASTRAC